MLKLIYSKLGKLYELAGISTKQQVGSSLSLKYREDQNQITLGISNSTVELENTSGFLRSINNTIPYENGNLDILGSLCVSIVTKLLSLSVPEISNSHPIVIYDGCKACNDCSMYWDLQNMILLAALWLVGMKDNVLYPLTTSERLWKNAIKNRESKYTDVTLNNCILKTETDYKRDLEYGIQSNRLLYQYKALVAFWNYIVSKRSKYLKVELAPLSPTGFNIISQLYYNACLNSALLNLKVTIKQTLVVSLNSGQILQLNNRRLKLYYYFTENTRLLYSTTYTSPEETSESAIEKLAEFSDSLIYLSITYNPQKICNIHALAEVRILPVLMAEDTSDSNILILKLQDYINYKQKQVNTHRKQDLGDVGTPINNRWKVKSLWTINDKKVDYLTETIYYTTLQL